MSDEYTPDTIEVLQRWRPDGPQTHAEVQEVDAEFWRWLRVIVEGAKADAWDEGQAHYGPSDRINPYREQA